MPGIEKGGPRAEFCRKRLISPKKFDPRSFRIKRVGKTTKLVVGCPKGEYNAKKKKCRVGTRAQSKLKRKTKAGTCPVM